MAPIDPQCQRYLDAVAAMNSPSWKELGPTRSREVYASFTHLFGTGPENVTSEDRVVDDRVPIRIYRPEPSSKQISAQQRLPVVMYFHGGGWVIGNITTHDAVCRRVCSEAHCVVVSVDYRLSPEHPFPAPFDDCYDATKFVASHGNELGVDTAKLVVAGDSAGGNLVAAVALKTRNTSDFALLAQILIYPVIDSACDSESYEAFATGYGLTRETMQYFWECYLGGRNRRAYAIPAKAITLELLPEAIVVIAGYDVLRDEGLKYASDMQSAGVQVTVLQYDSAIHGFVQSAEAFDIGKQATRDIANQLKRVFQHV